MRGCLFKINSTRGWRAVFYTQFLLWPTVFVYVAGTLGVRLNLSSSVPIGLYLTSRDLGANLVEFCPPEPFGTLSVERGYRALSNACPDGGQALLKPVIAREGDLVEVSAAGIHVNGFLIENTQSQLEDSQNRPLPRWPAGLYAVARGTVWVASVYNPRSFDSRYFGPVRIASIKHGLRPFLITF